MGLNINRSLLVEDNAIIAMDCEEMLTELGAESVITCSSVEEALNYLSNNTVDFAILDVNLGTETSEAVAKYLAETDTPFLFATGHEETKLSESFPHAPVVQKPYSAASIEEAFESLNPN